MIININKQLKSRGLKITPQRTAIMEAVIQLNNHPTAEQIIEFIHKNHPGIATGTVYKVLDTLIENKLICKVKTERDIMRYEPVIEPHHHLYASDSDKIEDYRDEELDEILNEYFKKKNITGFEIETMKLHITGRFITPKK